MKFKITFCHLMNENAVIVESFKSEGEAKEWAANYLVELQAVDPSYCGFSLEAQEIKLYTHKDGILALKADRQAACIAAGVVMIEFGETMPADGILIADTRPKKFKGGRGPNDPAATMLYVGDVLKPKKTFYFEDFNRALNKALKLANI